MPLRGLDTPLVEGSLVRVSFSVPSQECVAGVGMQLPLSVKHEYYYRARQMASDRNLGNRSKVSRFTLFYLSHGD